MAMASAPYATAPATRPMLAIGPSTETSWKVGPLAGKESPMATLSPEPLTSMVAADAAGVPEPPDAPAGRTIANGSRPGKRLNETSWPSSGSGRASLSGSDEEPTPDGAGVPGAGEGVVVVV